MPITVDWYDEAGRIVVWKYTDQWAWEELFQAGVESDKLFKTTDERVDAIMVNHEHYIPPGAFKVFDTLADATMPDNLGLIIVVGSAPAGQTMIKISAKMNSVKHWKLAETVEQALAIIRDDRQGSDDGQSSTATTSD